MTWKELVNEIGTAGIRKIQDAGFTWGIPEHCRSVHISKLVWKPKLKIYLNVSPCGRTYSKPWMADFHKQACPGCLKEIRKLIAGEPAVITSKPKIGPVTQKRLRAEWLLANQKLWEGFPRGNSTDYETMREVFRQMQRAGLYSRKTNYSDVDVRGHISLARRWRRNREAEKARGSIPISPH